MANREVRRVFPHAGANRDYNGQENREEEHFLRLHEGEDEEMIHMLTVQNSGITILENSKKRRGIKPHRKYKNPKMYGWTFPDKILNTEKQK